jgi:hypothetical protein
MKLRIISAAIPLIFGMNFGSALAAAKIAEVKAVQSGALESQVTVTIERPTPLDMMCDASVDHGDGGFQPLKFDMADKRTKTLQHKYAKPGTYKVVVKATGKCEGMREVSLVIKGGAVEKVADKPSGKSRCPKGWTVVPASFQGNKYVCRAEPPAQPIKCEGGTKYFSENGAIGCR